MVVRAAGIYNASAVIVFLAPGGIELVGLRHPHSPFWVWLPALMGLFAGIVLFLSSTDLARYASFPYWNGIIRLIFVVLAVFSSATVADADVVANYKRILSPEDLVLSTDEAAGETTACYVWPPPDLRAPQALVDAELVFLVEAARRGTRGQLVPRRVELVGTAMEPGAGHAGYFGCPVHLGTPANAVVFDTRDLARPFLNHNPDLLRALVPYLRFHTSPAGTGQPRTGHSLPLAGHSARSAGPAASSASLDRSQDEIARVRSTIAERLRGQRPTVDAVGRDLAMSGRALQRLLQEHGTSFRKLLDDVRHQHAHGYLSGTSFSDSEVAFLLGFEDPTSFYRAFRGWTGKSPSEFRRAR